MKDKSEDYTLCATSLSVEHQFKEFIENELLNSDSIKANCPINCGTKFWEALEELVQEFTPRNEKLLIQRDEIQKQLDTLCKDAAKENTTISMDDLKAIGYIEEERKEGILNVCNVDEEISQLSGPQLVVPIDNARYALNAVNARWGSLFDALYGTDVIDQTGELAIPKDKSYNPIRGERVIMEACHYLDEYLGTWLLDDGSNNNSISWSSICKLHIATKDGTLKALDKDEKSVMLSKPDLYIGYCCNNDSSSAAADKESITPNCIYFKHHGLHIAIHLNDTTDTKKNQHIIKDVELESALTTIADFEDSVSVIDSNDKIIAYRNLLGLMIGNLESKFMKNNKEHIRRIQQDREIISKNSGDQTSTVQLRGRSLLLCRNVGIHMKTSIILSNKNDEIYEGILDAFVTTLAACHDLWKKGKGEKGITFNSRHGSIYIVKPKMHGSKEVQYTIDLFTKIEQILNLPLNTIKLGIMDEERRTSINLKNCIYTACNRVVFINTGFLDRTGDDIHSLMYLGPVLPKGEIKKQSNWMKSYEKRNVLIGLECKLNLYGQIGKGMWAVPNEMKNMITEKIGHPKSGASTAWVPSPTSATLHSLHYHMINVKQVQEELIEKMNAGIEKTSSVESLLEPALLVSSSMGNKQDIQNELDNNVQGILGYVTRWIHYGIGCSTVLDINNIGLMEDRATLRISSQHVTNWLVHNIITKEDILQSFQRMSSIVYEQQKEQNKSEEGENSPIKPITDSSSLAYQAALELILEGTNSPNGYTENILTKWRKKCKEQLRKQK